MFFGEQFFIGKTKQFPVEKLVKLGLENVGHIITECCCLFIVIEKTKYTVYFMFFF